MKAPVFLLLFLVAAVCHGQEKLGAYYQIRFVNARTNNEIAAFYHYCLQQSGNRPIDKAYLGTSKAMYAACAENVLDKLNYFNEGKALLESAIAQDFSNPEIRFLRLSVQEKSPRMLNYNNNLEQDAQLILQALNQNTVNRTSAFWQIAINFIKNAEQLSASTKSQFQGL